MTQMRDLDHSTQADYADPGALDDGFRSAAHTSEPWHVTTRGPYTVLADAQDETIAAMRWRTHPEHIANAERIVAAVNACTGIPTDRLSGLDMAAVVAALERVVAVGHNNDCMFCGWKDREVQESLTPKSAPSEVS